MEIIFGIERNVRGISIVETVTQCTGHADSVALSIDNKIMRPRLRP